MARAEVVRGVSGRHLRVQAGRYGLSTALDELKEWAGGEVQECGARTRWDKGDIGDSLIVVFVVRYRMTVAIIKKREKLVNGWVISLKSQVLEVSRAIHRHSGLWPAKNN
ncbi:hypothetical protein [Pseudomonas sp. Leaf127]|uniref:hypothetical protein n=1 Tax=Pseudomonas sp. Leaf127 TaxID=1736267 RepID=UPI0012E7A92A|nr:hypothetical protein [Pseudomonas sp. Leaf127]